MGVSPAIAVFSLAPLGGPSLILTPAVVGTVRCTPFGGAALVFRYFVRRHDVCSLPVQHPAVLRAARVARTPNVGEPGH